MQSARDRLSLLVLQHIDVVEGGSSAYAVQDPFVSIVSHGERADEINTNLSPWHPEEIRNLLPCVVLDLSP